MFFLRFLPLLALSLLPPSAHAQTLSIPIQTYHVVPFIFNEVTPNPVGEVKINDGPALPFIVDTGTAAPVVIQPWVRDVLKLKASGDTPDNSHEVDLIDSCTLIGQDGDVKFDPNLAVVVDLGILDSVYGHHRIAGLIGIGLFTTTAAEFDFKAKALVVYENHDRFEIDGATKIRLTINNDGVATVPDTLAPGKSTDLPIDTGGMLTGVPASLTSSLAATDVITRHWTGQVSGMYMCPDFLLPTLDVGGLQVPNVVVETLPDTARCTIGLNILTQYRTIVDIPHGELILAPRSDAPAGYGRGWTGIHFDPGSTVWRVHDLEAGSPARKGGVKEGDEIVSIDGYELGKVHNPAVIQLLD